MLRGWILVIWIFTASVQATDILVIESYHKEFLWDANYLKGITKEIPREYKIETFEMNTKRLPRELYEEQAQKAFQVYKEHKPKIVILGDDNALSFMLPKLYDEEISIVFLGVNSNPRKLMQNYQGRAQITGILEQPLFIRNVGEIGALLPPDKKKIKVMFDSGVTSGIANDYMQQQYDMISRSLGIEVELFTIATQQDWKETLLSAKDDDTGAVIVGLYQTLVDEQGKSVDADSILSWTNKHSPVPLFGFWDFSIGEGKAAGGVVLFGESQGRKAGQISRMILEGEKSAQEIPIQIGIHGRAIYNMVEMQRWGLVPPDHWKHQ